MYLLVGFSTEPVPGILLTKMLEFQCIVLVDALSKSTKKSQYEEYLPDSKVNGFDENIFQVPNRREKNNMKTVHFARRG